MKTTAFIFIVVLFYGCSSVEPDINYRQAAEGFWKTTGGNVTNDEFEIGLIFYNWYAINTSKDAEKVFVTWDNGLNCTETEAALIGDKIIMKVKDINCAFKIVDEKSIEVVFITPNKTYTKYLEKISGDPRVLCY